VFQQTVTSSSLLSMTIYFLFIVLIRMQHGSFFLFSEVNDGHKRKNISVLNRACCQLGPFGPPVGIVLSYRDVCSDFQFGTVFNFLAWAVS